MRWVTRFFSFLILIWLSKTHVTLICLLSQKGQSTTITSMDTCSLSSGWEKGRRLSFWLTGTSSQECRISVVVKAGIRIPYEVQFQDFFLLRLSPEVSHGGETRHSDTGALPEVWKHTRCQVSHLSQVRSR